MFGGNRTAQRQHDAVHGFVHVPPAGEELRLVRPHRLGNIVMDVAVAQMAEGADTGARDGSKNRLFRRRHELRYSGNRDGDIVLDGAALRLLRIRHALAHVPQCLTLGFGGGDHGILDQPGLKTTLQQQLHHRIRRLGRIGGGDVDECVPVMGLFQGIAHAGNMSGGKLHANPWHELEAGQRRAAEV